MPHPSEHTPAHLPVKRSEASEIAESMSVFGAPSRVRLLYALLDRPSTVDQLAAAAELEPSAASHQLRVLRQLRFVVAEREGRRVRYRLHDHHIADLLAAVRHHHEHAARGWSAPEAAQQSPAARR